MSRSAKNVARGPSADCDVSKACFPVSGGGRNAIFVLAGDGGGERAVVRDVQYHKVRGNIVHVDFLRINPEEEISSTVPLNTVGTPVGVSVSGGALQHSVTNVDMTCIAAEMPSQVEIDITDLEIGDSIHVSDLLETESRITTDPGVTIVSVLQPRLTADEETDADEIDDDAVAEEGDAEEGDDDE
jgi:large subunit ribosomal protein L25